MLFRKRADQARRCDAGHGRVLPESRQWAGRFDPHRAIIATARVALLVYGLSNAPTTPDGVSRWGDTRVVVSLVAAAVLLVAFGVIETRSQDPLLAIRAPCSRNRSGRT